jgi:hypothetical protein
VTSATSRLTRPLTRGPTASLTAAVGGEAPASSVRAIIVGQDIQYPPGTTLRQSLKGYNFGAYGTVVLPGDVAQCIADGVTLVRVVGNFRWFGSYGTAGTDSRDDSAYAKFSAGNWSTMKEIVRQLTAAGIWVVVTFDSDCAINGGLTDAAYCTANVGGSGAWPNGYNVFTSPDLFNDVRAIWQMAAREFRSYPKILGYELGSEPLVGGGTFDATWDDDLRNYYNTVANDIKAIEPLALFIAGGRGYDKDSMAGVILSGRTDFIYTWNLLSNGLTSLSTVPGSFDTVGAVAASSSVPLFMNQMGSRSDGDPSEYALRAGWSVANARGIATTWWQVKDKSTSTAAYGIRYDDGAGGFATKAARLAAFTERVTQTLAGLEAAAIAAATAESAHLFYVQPAVAGVYPNVFQNSAGSTQVTALGQPIGLVNPVVGASLTLQQATAGARPLLGVASPYLIDARPVLLFDAVNTYLSGSAAFFSSGSQMTVIASGIPANTANAQDFVYAGGSSGVAKWPRLAASAAKVASSVWQSDTTTNTVTGAIGTATFPIVMSCTRDGSANKIVYSNGLQDGSTNNTADGTIASFTRLRVGGSTTNNPTFSGPIALICLKVGTMSAANRQAIERFAAYLVGAGYQL